MVPETENQPFQPRKLKEDDMYGKLGYTLNLLQPNIYQFESRGVGCHVYLILSDELNVLIDSGIITKFPSFNYLLASVVGLSTEDIDLIINTHEHFDHISSNCYFPTKCPVAAHKSAAAIIQFDDEMITMTKKHSIDIKQFKVHFWLEDGNVFDLGNVRLKVVATPGHSSGSICIFEPEKRFLFTGDTLFKGAAANIYQSGSISELMDSLRLLDSLRINMVYPGHGKIMSGQEEVSQEIANSLVQAQQALDAYIDRITSKPVEDIKIPPSLYNRD